MREDKAHERVSRFLNALRNIHKTEQDDIRNIVMGVLYPTPREQFVTLNYHRAAMNVELLVTLMDTRHFQAIAMLARTIFELAVELKLISMDPDAARKIELFTRVEMLHSADKLVDFKKNNPDAIIHHETQAQFIDQFGAKIRQEQSVMWPNHKNVNHWTGKKLQNRIKGLGEPFERIYDGHYPQLSWYSHSGVTGLENASTKSIAMLAGISYAITADSYMKILEIVVNEFKLYITHPTLKDKIEYMKVVAFAESQGEANALLEAYAI